MADAVMERTMVNISISGAEEQFVAQGEVVQFDGFIKVYRESIDDDDQQEEERLCAILAITSLASCKKSDHDAPSEKKYFTVTFDSNGGSEVQSLKIAEGGKVSKPQDPQRDNYIFDCWTYNSTKWSFEVDTVKSDITLIAKWVEASDVYSYEPINDTENKITGVKKNLEAMVVPGVIGGKTITAIGDGVFESTQSENTKSITLSKTVTSIGNASFKDCVDVEITVKGQLVKIGEQAFLNCNALKEVNFGEGLTAIPFEAFKGCSALTELSLPASLLTIDENAFEDCSALSAIIMHTTLSAVNDGAFDGASVLEVIYLYGKKTDIANISISENNDDFYNAITQNSYFYSKDKPSISGDYWYFNEKGKIRVWDK